MLSTHRRSSSERPISLKPTTRLATNLAVVSSLALIACWLFSARAQAQASLPLGTMTVNNTQMVLCDPTGGWYYYGTPPNTVDLVCKTATISCSNSTFTTEDIGLMFGWLSPVGIVPGVSQALAGC